MVQGSVVEVKWNCLKKQSQFLQGVNELKCLYERMLQRISCFETAKKQSQSKPISASQTIVGGSGKREKSGEKERKEALMT